ncbi:MAG: hypothetical protein R6U96_00155 [Promethearchaeia archaeon]
MSYIEKKYLKKIKETFEILPESEKQLKELLNQKTLKNDEEISKLCSKFNKEINKILKKYYPEVKDLKDKLRIKSKLKFYYDLIDKLTDLIRNIDNFQKIDDNYYEELIKFINEKNELIEGKYKQICQQELAVFYNKNARSQLEEILTQKIENKENEFFTFGSLEQEIKKIGAALGADSVSIEKITNESIKESLPETVEKNQLKCIIYFTLPLKKMDKIEMKLERLLKIGVQLKKYLQSKNYTAELLINKEILKNEIRRENYIKGLLLTNAELFEEKKKKV